MIGPKPWRELEYFQTFIHRNQDCPIYDGCLAIASDARWTSFTCVYCSMSKGTWKRKFDPNTFLKEESKNANFSTDVDEMEIRNAFGD